jgi:Asp-tRNA(Asn)/Glu-tRNA(Gln) amidotransferase A subunit family amidase
MSLRDALKAKQRRTTYYDLLISDPSEAEKVVEEAEGTLRLALLRNSDDVEDCRAAVTAAQERLREHVHRITFVNLPPDEFEELVAAHPPGKDQKKDDEWHPSFRAALVAACAVDSDLSEDEWAAELKSERWNEADRSAIFAAALSANVTPRSVTIPKG